jgi:capsid assembly protease
MRDNPTNPHDAGFFVDMPHVATRIFDTPLLVEQSRLDVILNALAPRMGFRAQTAMPFDAQAALAEREQRQRMVRSAARSIGMDAEMQDEGYYLVGHTAVVPMIGTTVQRGGWLSAMSGLVSYNLMQTMLAAAVDDRRVEHILLEVDSPGGEVAGAFDFADYVHGLRGKKPITAVANELAASAGYLVASAADEVVVNRTARVGSIGVVFAHMDRSKALEKAGVAVTFVYAGEKKIDGNSAQPLPARVKAELQASVDQTYELFVETVARNTGLSAEAIRKTQAGMYAGREAVDVGLAKRVNTLANELQLSVTRTGARSVRLATHSTEVHMSASDKPAGEGLTHTAAQVEAARAEGKAEGMKAGVESERARIKAIVNSAEAEGRGEMASHLAFEESMAADKAIALLAKSPKAAAAPGGAEKTPLERAMEAGAPGSIANTETPDAAPKAGSWDPVIKKFGGK